jgi:hypothetical protein
MAVNDYEKKVRLGAVTRQFSIFLQRRACFMALTGCTWFRSRIMAQIP